MRDLSFEKELEEAKEQLKAIDVPVPNEEMEVLDSCTKYAYVNGEKIKLDFGSLTGKKIIILKAKYRRLMKSDAQYVPELDEAYLMLVAEEVSGVDYDTLVNLKNYQEFKDIKEKVQNFLVG
ncbi:hypothetical protein [Fusobacterium hominis]|uniref:Phage protein n=1 Tax=Fusobacterium hominis TaxID=2764326 RepID=A0A7G9GXI5_9FUSO|nr:hypothetical protein [Fusobacterium hominis]QNM15517.1 hypothetical protein H9Q81_01365 [Fusobacterium hominis]